MTDWEKAKARLGEFLRVRGGTIPAQAEADIRSALEEVEDARSYAAEIAQGVSHYPHEEAEPCVRCRAERAEAKLAVCVEALRECQRVFDHPAFTDRAGIGDVCRAALAAAKGGE